jgi:hypothetical protein
MDRFRCPQIHTLVLHCAPQSFNKHVVQPPPFAIHAYSHPRAFQRSYPSLARKLAALIRVEDFRSSSCNSEGFLKCLQAEPPLQCVRELPRQHRSRTPIHHRHQVRKTFAHRDVGNVCTPRFISLSAGDSKCTTSGRFKVHHFRRVISLTGIGCWLQGKKGEAAGFFCSP